MIFLYFILMLYVAFIGALIIGFFKIKEYEKTHVCPNTKFSIVVPFRNEAQNLPVLLESISKLDYPLALFEVILVDDESVDGFEIENYKFDIAVLKNIRTSNSPKKDAITTAINTAKNDWIITTDADCHINPKWLLLFDNCIQTKNPEMISGAVKLDSGTSFLHYFEQLDVASLLGATIGSFGLQQPFMCNGANFAYSKAFFKKMGGFEGNDNIASGDDVFLLQKAAKRFPEKVVYLKSHESVVVIKAVESWKALFYQRVRWASKAGSYQVLFGKLLGLVVFFGNLSWIICFLITFFSSLYSVIFMLLLKIIADFILILLSNQFLQHKTRYFILGSLLYPFFSVPVALYSVFGKYEWKGRTFSK